MRQHSRPFWPAALLNPWLATFGFCLYAVLFAPVDTPTRMQWPDILYAALTQVLPASYAAACGLLLPYAHWLRTRALLSVPSICAGTVVAGLAAAAGYSYITAGAAPQPLALRLGVGLGLLLGLGFCLLAGVSPRRRAHVE